MKVFTVICPTFLPTAVPSTVEAHTKKSTLSIVVYSMLSAWTNEYEQMDQTDWTWANGPNLHGTWANEPTLA